MAYMKDRTAFGQSIAEFQALRHRLAELATEVTVCKTFNYTVAQALDKGEYVVKEATMSKLMSTKISDKVAYECVQFLGGYGYMEEYPMARHFRDSRLRSYWRGDFGNTEKIIAKMIIDSKSYKPVT